MMELKKWRLAGEFATLPKDFMIQILKSTIKKFGRSEDKAGKLAEVTYGKVVRCFQFASTGTQEYCPSF